MDIEKEKRWEIKRYADSNIKGWDSFVRDSRNSTFLFNRSYMDYHSDRFADCSLMAYKQGKLRAILPACITDDTLHSHQGLTYGGWLFPAYGPDGEEILEMWQEWLEWCEQEGIRKIIYKPVPSFYAGKPSEEDRYCLFRCGGIQTGCGLSSTIRLPDNPGLNKLQRRHLQSAKKRPSEIKTYSGKIPTEVVEDFHKMLSECLQTRHGVKAVHSAGELALLSERFPDHISMHLLLHEGRLEAGVWLFKTDTCHHCQYIATSAEGRVNNSLTLLFVRLIEEAEKAGKTYFDFGISTEDGGRRLNHGLNRHKTSFGASGTVYERWEMEVAEARRRLIADGEDRL